MKSANVKWFEFWNGLGKNNYWTEHVQKYLFHKAIKVLCMLIGDGLENQSYLMVHLLTLANLLVQFRYKKATLLHFLNDLNNEPRTFSNVCVALTI